MPRIITPNTHSGVAIAVFSALRWHSLSLDKQMFPLTNICRHCTIIRQCSKYRDSDVASFWWTGYNSRRSVAIVWERPARFGETKCQVHALYTHSFLNTLDHYLYSDNNKITLSYRKVIFGALLLWSVHFDLANIPTSPVYRFCSTVRL